MSVTLAAIPFLEGFRSAAAAPSVDLPPWLDEIRQEDGHFLRSFVRPSVRDEEWKYTPLTALWPQAYSLAGRFKGSVIGDEFKSLMIDGARNILIIDGQVAAGRAFGSLDEIRRCLSTVTPNDAELFLRLNRLHFQSLLEVFPGQNVTPGELVHIINVAVQPGTAAFPRIFIRAGRGAELNVLQTYVTFCADRSLSVPVTDIVLEEGARLEYAERHAHSLMTSHIGSVRAWLKKDSTFKATVSTSGAGIFRSNISVMMEEQGAKAELNGLHHLKADAHADSHTFLEHLAPETTSNQLYKCILADEARSVFNGRVYVHREAQKTSSYQLNKNLLLSRECRVDTKPQLEIRADDVKCTHGATISQLDEEQLFYLQTRAVGRQDAVDMLVSGFIDDVLSRISHPLLREALAKV